MQHGLELQNLYIQIDNHTLFAPLNLQIRAGEICSLMGPSGCGKSTLLACVSGTLDPVFQWQGTIRLHGQEIGHVPPQQRAIGLLFQDDLLLPHMSVGENLIFALPRKIPKAQRITRVNEALHNIEMQGYYSRKPHTISGGQRLRVALMRTLLAEPMALLLDEPFSKLDAELRERTRSWVFAHIRKQKIPSIMVTHDIVDAYAADPKNIHTLSASQDEISMDTGMKKAI